MDAVQLHQCSFGPLTVDFDDRVLKPRPWTLAQSEWAVRFADGPIVELCAGAGHIGLAAAVLADTDLVQVELDPVAAGYAARNAERAGWARRTDLRITSIRSALLPGEQFSLMIADPPYLRSEAVSRWPEDPVAAIDGGADGLDLVRDCLAVSAAHLTAPGTMLLQVAGPLQAEQVRACLSSGLSIVEIRTIDSERAIMRIDHG